MEKREKDLEIYLQTLLATFPDVAPRVLAHFLHFHFYSVGDAEESPGNLVTVQTDSVVLERGLRVCNF